MSVCHIFESWYSFCNVKFIKLKNIRIMTKGTINVSVENIFPLIKEFLIQ